MRKLAVSKTLFMAAVLLGMATLAGCTSSVADEPEPIVVATGPAAALVLEPDGTAVRGDLTAGAYENWFQVQATEGTAYYIYTSDLEPATEGYVCDTVVTLMLDEAIAADDDGGIEPLSSAIYWRAPASALYYVIVGRYGDDNPSGYGTYSVSLVTRPPADAGWGDATSLTVDGGPVAGRLEPGAARDWYSFEAVVGASYKVFTINLGPECDTVMYLRDADLIDLDWNDDYSSDEPRVSSITHTATYSGTHYVMLIGRDMSGGDYQIEVRAVPGP